MIMQAAHMILQKDHMVLLGNHMTMQGSHNLPFSAGSTPYGCMEETPQGQRSTDWIRHDESVCQQLITSPSVNMWACMYVLVHK